MSAGAKHIAAVLQLTGDLSWQDRALCLQVDPDQFFPEKGAPVPKVKQVCAACPVRPECLDYALGNGEQHGIWGGLSTGERVRLLNPRSRS